MALEHRYNICHIFTTVILSVTATTVIGLIYLRNLKIPSQLYINRDESIAREFLHYRFLPERRHITFFDSEVHPHASINLQKRLAAYTNSDDDELWNEADNALQLAIGMKLAGKNEKAAKLFKHALQLNPYRAETLAEYGGFLADASNDPARADSFIMKALILSPQNEKALHLRRRTQPLVESIDQQLFDRIETKKRALLSVAAQQTDDQPALRRAQKEFYFEHIYHTCAIEGNTLTLEETKHIIQTHLAVYGKSVQEHSEVIGLDAALSYINSTLVRERRPITLDDILDVHLRVLGYADPVHAGRLRKTQVFVSHHVPPPAENLTHLMNEYLSWLNSEDAAAMHPIKLAAVAHYWLAWLHPFTDGNGRTARLFMNLILMRSGYPPIIVRLQDRNFYFEKFREADEGDVRGFYRFMASIMERTVDQYLTVVVEDPALLKLLGVNSTTAEAQRRAEHNLSVPSESDERIMSAETIGEDSGAAEDAVIADAVEFDAAHMLVPPTSTLPNVIPVRKDRTEAFVVSRSNKAATNSKAGGGPVVTDSASGKHHASCAASKTDDSAKKVLLLEDVVESETVDDGSFDDSSAVGESSSDSQCRR